MSTLLQVASDTVCGNELREEIIAHCKKGSFILKEAVTALEEHLSRTYAINATAVASHQSALILALRAQGIQSGDTVGLASSCSLIEFSAVMACGVRPYLCDLFTSGTVSAEAIPENVLETTKVLIISGPQFQRKTLRQLREVLSDRTHIIRTDYLGSPIFEDDETMIAKLDRYTTPTLLGEAGIIFNRSTNQDRVVRMLRNHGQDGRHRFVHHLLGSNSRMDDINASMILRFHRCDGNQYFDFSSLNNITEEVNRSGVHHCFCPSADSELTRSFIVRTSRSEVVEDCLKAVGISVYPISHNPLKQYAFTSGLTYYPISREDPKAESCYRLPTLWREYDKVMRFLALIRDYTQ